MSLPSIAKSLNEAALILQSKGPVKDEERNAFYEAYEKVRAAIETPIDAAVRILFGVRLYSHEIQMCSSGCALTLTYLRDTML